MGKAPGHEAGRKGRQDLEQDLEFYPKGKGISDASLAHHSEHSAGGNGSWRRGVGMAPAGLIIVSLSIPVLGDRRVSNKTEV